MTRNNIKYIIKSRTLRRRRRRRLRRTCARIERSSSGRRILKLVRPEKFVETAAAVYTSHCTYTYCVCVCRRSLRLGFIPGILNVQMSRERLTVSKFVSGFGFSPPLHPPVNFARSTRLNRAENRVSPRHRTPAPSVKSKSKFHSKRKT